MAQPQEKITRQNPVERPDLTREYVVGTSPWSSRIASVLSNFIDDLESLIGIDVYERMSKDPTVSKNLQFQKLSVVSEGIQLHPAIADDTDPEHELANEIKLFHERSLCGLHRPVAQIVGEMMVALKRAHSVAEITYNDPIATGIDAYKLTLKSIKVKPRNSTAFVIDAFRNVLGLTTWTFGSRSAVSSAEIGDQRQVIPIEKFAVLAFETEDEDPRGVNPLRAAYNFWQAKCLIPGLHLKWLEKSGIPSVVGFTAQSAGNEQGEDGNQQSAQEVMAEKLAQLESGSSAAFPFGAEIEKIEVSGTGIQFARGYQDFDQQIDYALSLQSGATKDSQRGSYSSKTVMKDVLDILVWSRKQAIAQVFQAILKNGTRYNFGEDKVHLTPVVFCGDEEGKDFSKDAMALAALAPYLTDSQWNKLCQELGIAAPEDGETLPSRAKTAPPASSTDQSGKPNEDAGTPPADQPGREDQGKKAA